MVSHKVRTNSSLQLCVRKRSRFRPWLWPSRLLSRFTRPVPLGVWVTNYVFQRLLDVNNDCPWMVHFTSRVCGRVQIGKNVWRSFAISGGCYIQGYNGIEIGDDTVFAPGVKIISANHSFSGLQKVHNALTKPIRIGRRCWLGANSIILPEVELGDDVIVGAGAVVDRSFPPLSIVAGVPARLIRIREHLNLKVPFNPVVILEGAQNA
jgi:carbonic anhydrase/acetyltransferase-like protein (isoleucine patch superfamily)